MIGHRPTPSCQIVVNYLRKPWRNVFVYRTIMPLLCYLYMRSPEPQCQPGSCTPQLASTCLAYLVEYLLTSTTWRVKRGGCLPEDRPSFESMATQADKSLSQAFIRNQGHVIQHFYLHVGHLAIRYNLRSKLSQLAARTIFYLDNIRTSTTKSIQTDAAHVETGRRHETLLTDKTAHFANR